MALQTKSGTFNCPSSSGTQAVTGVGFQPECLIFFYTNLTADGSGAGFEGGIGICDDSLRQMTCGHACADGRTGTTQTRGSIESSIGSTDGQRAILDRLSSGPLQFNAEVLSLDTDGFTLYWNNVVNGVDIHYIAIAGATDYYVDKYTLPTSTGNFSVTGVGFQPDCVLQFVTGTTSEPDSEDTGIGLCAFNASEEYSSCVYSQNAQGITDAKSRQENKALAYDYDDDNDNWTATLSSMDSDGFTLNFSSVNSSEAPFVLFLALKGVSSKIGIDTQKTGSTGTKSTSGTGFQPDVVIFASSNKVSTVGSSNHLRWSLGVGIGSSDRRSIWRGDEHGIDLNATDGFTSDSSQNTDTTACLRMLTENGASPSLDAEADFVSLDSDGFTLDWTTVDGTAREFVYVALSDLGSVSSTVTGMVEAEGDRGTTYYVDYDTGDDGNDGLSTSTPWQHCPGDDNAGTNVASVLSPGDTVVFKGGVVYQGTATRSASTRVIATQSTWDGNAGNKITLISGDQHVSTWGSGRAIIDGETTKRTGIYILASADYVINGFEIRNIGAPESNAKGVDFENGSTSVDRGILRNCLIHDIDWDANTDGTYQTGLGVSGESSFCVIENNTIYNCSDKHIEQHGGATDPNQYAGDAIVRNNVCYTSDTHGIVIISDRARVYNNLVWDTTAAYIPGSPTSAYGIKVDEGSNNKIWNNIIYTGFAGIGIIVGRDNEIYHNTVYDIGDRGSGSLREKSGFVCVDDGSASDWNSPRVTGNKFYNNLLLHINGTSNGNFLSHTAFGPSTDIPTPGDSNEFKNNLFYGAEGDTSSTADRCGITENEILTGTFTRYSLSAWETEFVSNHNGVASGNTVGDPLLTGEQTDPIDVSPLPTALVENTDGYFEPDTSAFIPQQGSPAQSLGITVGVPFNIDIRGLTRTEFTAGAYEVLEAAVTTSLTTTRSTSRTSTRTTSRSTSMTLSTSRTSTRSTSRTSTRTTSKSTSMTLSTSRTSTRSTSRTSTATSTKSTSKTTTATSTRSTSRTSTQSTSKTTTATSTRSTSMTSTKSTSATAPRGYAIAIREISSF